MNWLQSKLHLFTREQRIDIISHVRPAVFDSLPEEEQNDLRYLFTRITSDTSKKSLDLVYDCLMRSVLFDGIIKVFKVNQGENFKIVVEPEEGDNYAPYFITVRENDTDALLSIPKEGTNHANQTLEFENFPLEKGEFYKARIQLEESPASGDGVALLGTVYFIVLYNVDS